MEFCGPFYRDLAPTHPGRPSNRRGRQPDEFGRNRRPALASGAADCENHIRDSGMRPLLRHKLSVNRLVRSCL